MATLFTTLGLMKQLITQKEVMICFVDKSKFCNEKMAYFQIYASIKFRKMRYFLATLLLHTASAELFETRLLLIKVPSMHTRSTNSVIAW